MAFRRDDGRFDIGAFASLISVGLAILGVMYTLIIAPLQDKIDNVTALSTIQAEVVKNMQMSLVRNEVIVDKQNDTLNALAQAVNKLADKIDEVRYDKH